MLTVRSGSGSRGSLSGAPVGPAALPPVPAGPPDGARAAAGEQALEQLALVRGRIRRVGGHDLDPARRNPVPGHRLPRPLIGDQKGVDQIPVPPGHVVHVVRRTGFAGGEVHDHGRRIRQSDDVGKQVEAEPRAGDAHQAYAAAFDEIQDELRKGRSGRLVRQVQDLLRQRLHLMQPAVGRRLREDQMRSPPSPVETSEGIDGRPRKFVLVHARPDVEHPGSIVAHASLPPLIGAHGLGGSKMAPRMPSMT